MDCYMAGAIDAIKRAVELHNSSIVQQHVCLVLKSFTNQFCTISSIVLVPDNNNDQQRNISALCAAAVRLLVNGI